MFIHSLNAHNGRGRGLGRRRDGPSQKAEVQSWCSLPSLLILRKKQESGGGAGYPALIGTSRPDRPLWSLRVALHPALQPSSPREGDLAVEMKGVSRQLAALGPRPFGFPLPRACSLAVLHPGTFCHSVAFLSCVSSITVFHSVIFGFLKIVASSASGSICILFPNIKLSHLGCEHTS